jgi:hypothetical protein
MVGEGWGCVAVVADRQAGWECWQTPAVGSGAPVLAARVQWPSGSVDAGPDRICTTTEQDDVRCFQPPRRGDKALKPLGAAPPPGAGAAAATSKPRSYLDGSALYPGPLAGLGCSGDESRVCCDLVARGQPVVVTGKLLPERHAFPGQSQVNLGVDVKVCALPPPSPPQP